MNVVLNKFLEALDVFTIAPLIDRADRVVIAYSGGADSQLLLRLLSPYLKDRGKDVLCAHVNHMIRGDEAFADEEKCVRWAESAGVPIRVKRADVPALARSSGTGIEETARNVRYAFFESLRGELGGNTLIATAHNADDNLETVIFNMMRGAGLRGMCGIPAVRDGVYIRPLLLCTGDEIREYCRDNDIPYCVDSTNADTEYSRNYIRNSVTPALKKLNPSPADAVSRMCLNLDADRDCLDKEAERFAESRADADLAIDDLAVLHDALLVRVLALIYKKAGGKRALSAAQLNGMARGVRSAENTFDLNLPDGLIFHIEDGAVSFINGPIDRPVTEIEGNTPLKIGGEPFRSGDFLIRAGLDIPDTVESNGIIYNLSIYKTTQFDKIKGDFFVRGRKEGDSYRFGGMTRKVKKLFSESGMTLKKRAASPIVCDGDGIFWIPGFPLRDGACADGADVRSPVYLCLYEKP